jgi:hypothetical protein
LTGGEVVVVGGPSGYFVEAVTMATLLWTVYFMCMAIFNFQCVCSWNSFWSKRLACAVTELSVSPFSPTLTFLPEADIVVCLNFMWVLNHTQKKIWGKYKIWGFLRFKKKKKMGLSCAKLSSSWG